MSAITTALSGLQSAGSRFDSTAAKIARQGTSSEPEDTSSLSQNAVSLLQAKNDYEANLKVAHTADEMTKVTLNLLA